MPTIRPPCCYDGVQDKHFLERADIHGFWNNWLNTEMIVAITSAIKLLYYVKIYMKLIN